MATAQGPTPMTYTRRLSELAVDDPDAVALVCIDEQGSEQTFTVQALARRSAQAARALQQHGVDDGALVVLALPNGPEIITLSYAAWWLGACVLPLSPKLPPSERKRVLAAAAISDRTIVVVDHDPGASDGLDVDALIARSQSMTDDPLPDLVPHPGRAIASGGSTGRPKIIVDTRPHVALPDTSTVVSRMLGREPGQTALIFGPLYHTLSYGTVFGTIFDRGSVVLMTRFDETLALAAIERHRAQILATVPAHLQRLARVPGIECRDLSSIISLYHSGAVCPPWLKRRWIELIGPTNLYEGFGSTEAVGMLVIRGDDWLAHPGSVGRGEITDVVVRDEHGQDMPDGEVGEIFLRWRPGAGYTAPAVDKTYRYWGSEPARSTEDGYVSVGDLGWLEAGYLYVADRRTDMIISGGVNLYPAEVESVLSEHPAVADVAVVGLPDDEWGKRVHAIIQRLPGASTDPGGVVKELDALCRVRLSALKAPKSYEFVASLPRTEAGKIRRAELAQNRADAPPVTELRP